MPHSLDGDLPDDPTATPVTVTGHAAPTSPSPDPADVSDAADDGARRRRRLVVLLATIAAGVLAVDQATKVWALHALDGERRDVLGDLLGLQLVFNPGAALSIATGQTWLLTVVAVVVVVVIARVARRIGSTTWAVALGLLLGGALGNLVDRLLRDPGFGRGYVIDFIAYLDWFVGNVADIAIVVAAALVVLLVGRGVGVDGTRDRDAAHDAAADVTPGRTDDVPPGASDDAERARG